MNLQATLRRNGTCCFLVTLSCCEPVKCDSLHDANDLLVRWSVYTMLMIYWFVGQCKCLVKLQ